jgi:hypothetical protein
MKQCYVRIKISFVTTDVRLQDMNIKLNEEFIIMGNKAHLKPVHHKFVPSS